MGYHGKECRKIFNGTAWNKVDNTDSVSSVNGQTGAVSLTTDDISEGIVNLYYLVTALKRGYAERRAQNTLQVARMNEDLENQKNKKNMAEMTLQALLKQIDILSAEIDAIKRPKNEEARPREATMPPKKGECYAVPRTGGRKARRKGKKSPGREK